MPKQNASAISALPLLQPLVHQHMLGESLKTVLISELTSTLMRRHNVLVEQVTLSDLELAHIIEDALLTGFQLASLKLTDVL